MANTVRLQWVKPTLVRKPVGETLGGLGAKLDNRSGEFPS
jgi:hypothetical protein